MNKKWLKIALGILCVLLIYRMFFYETPISEHAKQAHRVRDAFIVDMYKKHGLVCFGIGGSCMDNIKMISVSFDQFKESDITEARVLLVNCMEEFLRQINEDKDVRPFLVQYPFTNENVKISIFLQKSKTSSELQNVVHVFNVENKLIYYGYDKTHDKEKVVLREPYEEALKIVKESGRLDIDMSDERAAS